MKRVTRTLVSISIVLWLLSAIGGFVVVTFGGVVGAYPPFSAAPIPTAMHRIGGTYCAGSPICGGTGGYVGFDDPSDTRDPAKLILNSLELDGWIGDARYPLSTSRSSREFNAEVRRTFPGDPAGTAARVEVYFATPEARSRAESSSSRNWLPWFLALGALTVATVSVALIDRRRGNSGRVRTEMLA
jgi:hypothetical protein